MSSNSRLGRDLLVSKLQTSLGLHTKKEAEDVFEKVVSSIEETLMDNLNTNKFSIKLNSLGKFSVHHKPSIKRKIPFTGETKLIPPKQKVKFITLGRLRQLEKIV